MLVSCCVTFLAQNVFFSWWMFFSSIKEINRLVSKGISNIYFWGKPRFSNFRFCFSQKENLKKFTCFEEQKHARYIQGILALSTSAVLSTKLCLRFLLICFAREIKGFYESSLGNEVNFTNIMNISPNILAKN